MAGRRTLLVNIERMRREMDELLGDTWDAATSIGRQGGSGFSPRVDVFYSKEEDAEGKPAPMAVVTADLAGVTREAINLEVSGRTLVISGTRPVRRTEGRAYQQVEIPTGSFRRAIELGVDVDAERAKASFDKGLLRVELPVRLPDPGRRVPIEPTGETPR
jgi:HSP20 family protein